jgi:hypothetical protein
MSSACGRYDKENNYKEGFVGKPEGKGAGRKSLNNIKMDVREIR